MPAAPRGHHALALFDRNPVDAALHLITLYDNGCEEDAPVPMLPLVLGVLLLMLALRGLHTAYRRGCVGDDPQAYNTDSVEARWSLLVVHAWGGAAWPPHHYSGPAYTMLFAVQVLALMAGTAVLVPSRSGTDERDFTRLAIAGGAAAAGATLVHAVLRLPFMASTVVHYEHRCRAFQVGGFLLCLLAAAGGTGVAAYHSMELCRTAFFDWCFAIAAAAVASLILLQPLLCVAVAAWRYAFAKARDTAARRATDPEASCCCFCGCCVTCCGPEADELGGTQSTHTSLAVSSGASTDHDLTARRHRLTVRSVMRGADRVPFSVPHPVMPIHGGAARLQHHGGKPGAQGSPSPAGTAQASPRPLGSVRTSPPSRSPSVASPVLSPREAPRKSVVSGVAAAAAAAGVVPASSSFRASPLMASTLGSSRGRGRLSREGREVGWNPLQGAPPPGPAPHVARAMSMESTDGGSPMAGSPTILVSSRPPSQGVATSFTRHISTLDARLDTTLDTTLDMPHGSGSGDDRVLLQDQAPEVLVSPRASQEAQRLEPSDSNNDTQTDTQNDTQNDTTTTLGHSKRRSQVVFVGEADPRGVSPHYENDARVISGPVSPAPPRQANRFSRDGSRAVGRASSRSRSPSARPPPSR